MPGPVWCAACSVASPISHASGMSAIAASDELGHLVEVRGVVEEDDERAERERAR